MSESHESVFEDGCPIVEIAISPGAEFVRRLRKEKKPVPGPIKCRGFLDTGSDGIALDYRIIQKLGIPSTGYTKIDVVGGFRFPLSFQFDLRVMIKTGPIKMDDVEGIALMHLSQMGFDALIGRSVLDSFYFHYKGPEHFYTLTHP